MEADADLWYKYNDENRLIPRKYRNTRNQEQYGETDKSPNILTAYPK